MTCIVSLITESSLHTKDGHIDLIASLNIVWSLQKHATEMQTHYRSSFFLLLVPMAGLEGELGALLRVDMAGLPLFGVNFFLKWPSSSCAGADLHSCQLCAAHLILKGVVDLILFQIL